MILADWRNHIAAVSTLQTPVDPARDHVVGDPAAPVAIIEYGDYQCSECAEAHSLRHEASDWIEQGRACFVFRHFPLIDAHPRALRAAQALEGAAAQGRFLEMHDLLMASTMFTDLDGQENRLLVAHLDDEALLRYARHLGLDLDRFRATMGAPATLEHIMSDFRGGLRSGVNGTPTFYLGSERQDVSGPDQLFDRAASALAEQGAR